MSRIILLTLSLVLYISSALAQNISLSGRVVDENNQPLHGAQILLKERSETKILDFAVSSNNGGFAFNNMISAVSIDSLVLEFSYIGYARKQIAVSHNNNKEILVKLDPRGMKVKEVVVNIKDIVQKKDTIVYRVDSFASIEDRTIGDVLKKMPGVEIMDSGAIKYQGREISKFYIGGSDMLGGRYGLATNNISHEDVHRVEVMENHQSIKAIEDISFSDATAMNIELKESAKVRWAGTAKVGGGFPDLWVGELFAMRFKKSFQTMNSYKTNNSGGDSFDFTQFFSFTDFGTTMGGSSLNNYINIAPTTSGDIGAHRSNFNKTHNVSSNSLFKLKNGYDLTTELIATHERKESDFTAKTTYYLPDGDINVEDKIEIANSLTQSVSGNIRLKANENNLYMNNNLDFSYKQTSTDIGIDGTFANVQNGENIRYNIKNDFDILKRKGDKVFTYRSSIGFSSLPQQLTVTKEGEESVNQDINLSSFHFNNSYDYSIGIGKFRLSAPINLNYSYRDITNSFDGETNQMTTNKLHINTTPSFKYDFNSFVLDINANLYYQPMNVGGDWHNIYGVNPRASMTYIASPTLKLRASGSYVNGMPDESRFFDGYIMSNYRNLSLGYLGMQTGYSTVASTAIEYKDVLKSLFANINFSYSKGKEERISAQDFEDEYIVSYYIPGEQEYQAIMLYGSVGTNIDVFNSTITLSPMFLKNRSTIVRNSESLPYDSESYSARLAISSEIRHNLTFTYSGNVAYNKFRSNSEADYSSISRYSQKMKLSYAPIKKIQLSYGFEHFCNELQTDEFKNFFFSDISGSYLWGKRTELTLSVKNIFDENYYSYFTESDLSSFYRSYKIRPRNILVEFMHRF